MQRPTRGTQIDTTARILIVDDDAMNVAVLQGVLESAGYHPVSASSGREALACLAANAPDLILLDVMLPELDGFAVCRHIKESSQWCNIPIIIITALDAPDDYTRAMDCGADDFMTKPFPFAVLLARVHAYLRAKRALEELRQSEDRYRQLVELSPDAIFVQCEGKIVFVNEAGLRLLRATAPAQLLGRPILDSVHPDLRDIAAQRIQDVQNGLTVPLLEERYIRLDGTAVAVEVAAIPIIYQDRHSGLVVVRDISERMQIREALQAAKETAEAANLAKSQFMANMSHELRTPLNAIIGYGELLQEEVVDLGQDVLLPDLHKIHTASKHLLNLINDILDLSKIEAGKMTVCLETFDVTTVMQDALGTIGPLVARNANTLDIRIAEAVGSMYSDLTKVQQCVLNLLSNACKFTQQGTVTLAVHQETIDQKDWLFFQVRDTGIGMTTEQIAGLFQPFSQADTSTTRKYGGTGLGLAITQRYCHLLGGDITLESRLGEGSTCTIQLPTQMESGALPATAQTIQKSAPALRTPVPAGQSGQTILVIDDDPIARGLLVRVLTKDGWQVVATGSGTEGLRLARAVRPTAIMLDVLMPDLDGWAVLTALQEDPELATTPVLMLSITDNQHKGFSLGAADFFIKPIDSALLVQRLQQYKGTQ